MFPSLTKRRGDISGRLYLSPLSFSSLILLTWISSGSHTQSRGRDTACFDELLQRARILETLCRKDRLQLHPPTWKKGNDMYFVKYHKNT